MAVAHENVGYRLSDLDCGRYEDLGHASVIAANGLSPHFSLKAAADSLLPRACSRSEPGGDVGDKVASWHEQTTAHSSGGG